MSRDNQKRDSITIPLTINKYKHRKLYDYLQKVKQGQKSFAMRELMEAGMETEHRYNFVDNLLVDENDEFEEINQQSTRKSSKKEVPASPTEKNTNERKKKEISTKKPVNILNNVKVFK